MKAWHLSFSYVQVTHVSAAQAKIMPGRYTLTQQVATHAQSESMTAHTAATPCTVMILPALLSLHEHDALQRAKMNMSLPLHQ